ncbi:CPBP family intramembrane glutamic endopeptidase [Bacillus sp. V3-13]|uniref:CPBP family intramembrane glutamic endopeptidase n=1 Tax=Bacillus sp. V3-13 TaxID=2053728 RepID=UPI0015E0E37B|nr:CPBP family intramembrane glutamic endopeptidase [Bacillus sp. V3-13]
MEKSNHMIGFILISLFVFMILLFELQLFTLLALFSLGLFIAIAFIKEENRLFIWVTLAFLAGQLLQLYGDRFLDAIVTNSYVNAVMNRFLILVPILLISYVAYMFKRKANLYWNRPDWNEKIYFPFIWSGFHSLKASGFLAAALSVNIAVFLFFIFFNGGELFLLEAPLFIAAFSLVNGLLEEILWRGVLLTRFAAMVGEKWAVLFNGAAFGFSHLAYGYSFISCLGFAIGGLFLAGLTIRSASLLPAALWHICLNLLMILSGVITIS